MFNVVRYGQRSHDGSTGDKITLAGQHYFSLILAGKRNHSDDDGIAEKKARLVSDEIPWIE